MVVCFRSASALSPVLWEDVMLSVYAFYAAVLFVWCVRWMVENGKTEGASIALECKGVFGYG